MAKESDTNTQTSRGLDQEISGAGGIPSAEAFGTPSISMRVYFSSYYLWAAEHFMRLASNIEGAHQGRSRFDIKHRAYVTGSVFASVTFLEAAINELFKDAADKYESYVGSLNNDVLSKLAVKWKKTEGDNKYISILKKYQLALEFAQQPAFIENDPPYKDVDLLIELRNELVHYKPQTLGGMHIHMLEGELENKFPINALMADSGNPFFPDKCLGYGCAKWALTSSRSFADDFFNKVGVIPNYKRVRFPVDE